MSTSPTIDHCRTFATRCITEGLSSGLGSPKPGEMCIEALWCNVLGLPHSDDPRCVASAVRRYKIGLNDASHADNKTRAECLVRLGVAQMGSKGVVDDGAFARRVTELTIREILPPVFRSVADRLPSHADRLNAAADRMGQEGTREAAMEARASAHAAYAAQAHAAHAAHTAAAYAAHTAAAHTAAAHTAHTAAAHTAAAHTAAAHAAHTAAAHTAAAHAAYAAAAYAAAAHAAHTAAAHAAHAAHAAYAAKRQDVLQHAANIGERVLRELGSPGIAWLDQLEAEGLVPAMREVTL